MKKILVGIAIGGSIGATVAGLFVKNKKDKEYNDMVDYVNELLEDKIGMTVEELAAADDIAHDMDDSLKNPELIKDDDNIEIVGDDPKDRTSIVVMEQEEPTKYHKIVRPAEVDDQYEDDESKWKTRDVFNPEHVNDMDGGAMGSVHDVIENDLEQGQVVISEEEFNDPDFTIHEKKWCGWFPDDDVVAGEGVGNVLGTSIDLFPDIDLDDVFNDIGVPGAYLYIRDYDNQISYCIIKEEGSYGDNNV